VAYSGIMPAKTHFESLDEEAVGAIAALFDARPRIEPYSPDGTPVYRVELQGKGDGVKLILWPSLQRVDVSSGGEHSWVLKNVGQVEVIAGVEVVFRPKDGEGYLFVSINGFINMVMG
jgi:hypothetical protein